MMFSLAVNTLEIRSSSHKGLSVPDASLVPVSSTIDVIELMNLGHRNRAVGATALNDRSSRSHRYTLFIFLLSSHVFMMVFHGKRLTIVFLKFSILQLFDCSCSRKRFDIWSYHPRMHAFG
jgi:hypothetical protein